MSKLTIHPTGTCFEDVTLEFIKMIGEDIKRMDSDFYMVHSICIMPDGKEYAHAWIEEGDLTWFPGLFNGEKGFAQCLTTEFYETYNVKEFTRYNFHDVTRVAHEHDDRPPPWELKYLKLCKDYKKKEQPIEK